MLTLRLSAKCKTPRKGRGWGENPLLWLALHGKGRMCGSAHALASQRPPKGNPFPGKPGPH